MTLEKLKPIIEALLSAADRPLSVNHLFELFTGDLEQPAKDDIRKALHELVDDYQGKGMEIKQVASGFRLQVNAEYSNWITRLWQQKPPRYSRALLETLALIAYRQPITRGEIEAIRGVSVSSNIIKTLQEREWVKTLGHKDVPGRPSLYGTTSQFLDYFNLKTLNEMPTLSELKDLDQFHPELAFNEDSEYAQTDSSKSEENGSETGPDEDKDDQSESIDPSESTDVSAITEPMDQTAEQEADSKEQDEVTSA